MSWNVENRRVWPASFRVGVDASMDTGIRLQIQRARSGRKAPPPAFWMLLLEFLPRDWFVGPPPALPVPVAAPPTVEEKAPPAPQMNEDSAEARRRKCFFCEWCQRAPMDAARGLSWCKGCYKVRYCSSDCAKEAWSSAVRPHQPSCKAEQKRIKAKKKTRAKRKEGAATPKN